MTSSSLDRDVIVSYLQPFLGERKLTAKQLEDVHIYLELLLRWNARINLTAVRKPEEIITRHFGESFFLADLLLESGAVQRAIDFGSGAGFPGVPLKLLAPDAQVTLIESQGKKATFLREVIRTLTLTNVDVFAGRAKQYSGKADVVTMRAVESFEQALAAAATLLQKPGRMGLLIGLSQVSKARELLPALQWETPVAVPQSRERVVLVGRAS